MERFESRFITNEDAKNIALPDGNLGKKIDRDLSIMKSNKDFDYDEDYDEDDDEPDILGFFFFVFVNV